MDVTLGSITLTQPETSGVRWVLDRNGVVGWGSPAGTLAPQQKPRQDGAWGGLSYRKPRAIVMAGTCYAPTEDLALDALDRLSSAAALSGTTLTVAKGSSSRWASVRLDGEVLPVWLDPTAFTWSIQLVAVDPRKFGASLTAATALPSVSGGLTIPFTIPFTIASTVTSGQVSLTNPGNETGPVRLRIDGPVTGPVVTHAGSGLRLSFATSLSLGVGEFLTVDMESHQVLAQGQAPRNGWVTNRGWSGFEPGPNTWAFSATTGAGVLTVTATPAWQ